jgi:hypothetical protein
MNLLIPLSYQLNIYDIYEDNIQFRTIDNKIIINNFNLFYNEDYLIYKISSNINLICLLDFLYNYDNIIIKKIYYYLIIKYLFQLKKKIYYSNYFSFKNRYFDRYINNREFSIFNNDKIVITDIINFNICLLINNQTLNKSFLGIIDKNTNINCLYDILIDIYNENRYEDIKISIIGGELDNIHLIIKIFVILKSLKLSKYIHMTYLNNNKPLNRIKYNSINKSIKFVSNINNYDNYDYSYHKYNFNDFNNYYSNLHKKT